MSGQPMRTAAGGLIDRSRALNFRFDGRDYTGYAGDTLASALLANGVRLLGRSFKYHRPRGLVGCGSEEPNALVRVGEGPYAEPNTRATQVELHEGLVAHSQNAWPSLRHDLGGLTNAFSRLLPAGFYYKTFMWPARWWPMYEHVIRRMAGIGVAPSQADPDHYAHHHAHCDVLVVGAGPAGLAAALAAARGGARVVLVDEGARLGGSLLDGGPEIDGVTALAWAEASVAELAALPNVTLLPRTTAIGAYDQRLVALAERVTEHQGPVSDGRPRQRLWMVRCREVVLASGAIERPLVFADNDRPGIMLASAACRYLRRYGVRAGRRAVVFCNNDDGYRSALDLHAGGVEVVAIADLRQQPDHRLLRQCTDLGIRCLVGAAVVGTRGKRGLTSVDVAPLTEEGAVGGGSERIDCDLLAMAGGWTPTLHLYCHAGGRLRYEERAAALLAESGGPSYILPVGAAAGEGDLAAILAAGVQAGVRAARETGYVAQMNVPRCASGPAPQPTGALWAVPLRGRRQAKRFVDLQDDVTADDIALAAREGYRSVEHLKRYTTLGMGTDQGKTSNLNGLAILAGELGREIPQVGTTTFRPPYTPVTIGALAGSHVGRHLEPVRHSPIHAWHAAHGAVFVNAGQWVRARHYPQDGESVQQAATREARAVRTGVGLVDVSTLGKIDIQGRDAAEFLDRVYINGWKSLAVGACRYGLMLREDGFVLDDGTTTRVGEHHYLMTTTTANAARVMSHLEFYQQCVWPELEVELISVSEEWAGMALAGPQAREVLSRVVEGVDVGNQAMPFLAYREGRVRGVPVRLFRISYSGELAYEIHVQAAWGQAVWEAVMAAGAPLGITPYGTEAMNVLRVEKGHVVIGTEIDGRTTPDDLGMGRMLSRRKDCIGRRSLDRPALQASGRKQLVGLLSEDRRSSIPAGAQLVADAHRPSPVPMVGHVTASVYSPVLERPIALALLEGGRDRLGERLIAASPVTGEEVAVIVASAHFYDPQGERMHD